MYPNKLVIIELRREEFKKNLRRKYMSSAAVLGIGFAATALTARQLILAGEAWMLAPPKLKQFYKGGFDDQMSRREAALILGIRESAAKNKVMEAHRKVMMANHPDAGGSPFVSTKVNEAKEVLLGKKSKSF